MAATPEAKVKSKIHKALKDAGAYAVNYIGGMYAANGTPDILACLDGRFIGIEAKAGYNKPTGIQVLSLRKIAKAGGLALVINEKSLDHLDKCLADIHNADHNYQPYEKILDETDNP